MIFQIPLDRACVFHWSPHWLPDPGSAAPVLKLVANGQTAQVDLVRSGTAQVSGVQDRYTLTAAGDPDTLGGLVGDIGGSWFLDAQGHGQFPVTIAHYDDGRGAFVLAEPLPHGLPSDAEGTLYNNQWTASIPAGTAGAAEDRAAYWAVDWVTDFDPSGANLPGQNHTDRGRLRVVRCPFETGLTAANLKTLVPQLEATRPPNRDGWQPLIDAIDIMGAVESRLPGGTGYADQTLGEQWRRSHALLAAAHIAEIGYAPNVDAERIRELAEQELDRQSRRVHWFDTNSDGAVDSGEADIAIGHAGTGLSVSSGTTTAKDYEEGYRYQPKLNNSSDR